MVRWYDGEPVGDGYLRGQFQWLKAVVGDMIVFRLDERSYALTGIPEVANWLRYNLEVDDYGVSTNFDAAYALTAVRDSRDRFRYSIQGPTAMEVVRDVVVGAIPDIPFFQFRAVSIYGVDCCLFPHRIAGETGYEFWGPYEAADEVWDAVVEAGRGHGLRRIGNRSYQTMSIESGWMPGIFPAIFGDHDRMRGYRDWIDADVFTRLWSPGGSFAPDDVSAFYLDPVEAGYGHLIDFGHDFLGRDALEVVAEEQQGEKVTLVWNDDDVVDQLDDEGLLYDLLNLPRFSLLLIVNREADLLDGLEDRLASRLGGCERIRLDRYSADQPADILTAQADAEEMPWDIERSECERIPEAVNGDAQVAMTTLRIAARSANGQAADRLSQDIVERALPEARQELQRRHIDGLPSHHQMIFRVIEEHDRIAPPPANSSRNTRIESRSQSPIGLSGNT